MQAFAFLSPGPYASCVTRSVARLIIALLATAVAEGNAAALLGSALVILGAWLKACTEERFLLTELGPEIYGAYCRRVPMLIPFFAPPALAPAASIPRSDVALCSISVTMPLGGYHFRRSARAACSRGPTPSLCNPYRPKHWRVFFAACR